jgi:hypothetical protein
MSGFPLDDAVLLLSSGSYEVTRRTAAPGLATSYVNGIRVPPQVSKFQITASVQPATGLDVQRLPEGKRNQESIKLFTPTELKSAERTQEPDLVAIDGASFEVQLCKRWDKLGSFFEVVLVRGA